MSCSFVLNLNCCNTLFRSKTWRLPPCADLKIQKMVISSDLLYTELPTCTKPLLRRLIWMYSCIVVRKVGEEIQCHLKHLSAHGPNSPWPLSRCHVPVNYWIFRWSAGYKCDVHQQSSSDGEAVMMNAYLACCLHLQFCTFQVLNVLHVRAQ